MNIEYFGHSAVAVHEGRHTVLIDPFLEGNPHLQGKKPEVRATTILLTHGHEDHVGDAVEISKKTGAVIVATYELASHLAGKGATTNPCNLGGRINYDWGWSRFVPAWHSSSHEGKHMGMPCGVVFHIGGRTFYHAGDTCIFGDMKLIAELYRPEIAFLPIGGHFTMDIFEATRAVELIQPELVIPIHFNTFDPIKTDAQEFKKEVESKGRTRVEILKPMQVWEVPARVRA